MMAKVNALREIQSAAREELRLSKIPLFFAGRVLRPILAHLPHELRGVRASAGEYAKF